MFECTEKKKKKKKYNKIKNTQFNKLNIIDQQTFFFFTKYYIKKL